VLDASDATTARRRAEGVLGAICVYATTIGSPASLCGAMGSIEWQFIGALRSHRFERFWSRKFAGRI